jgi:uncharacterized protein YegL
VTTIMPGGGIASRPFHLIIAADRSHSMVGARMQSLNFAVATMLPILREWEDRQEEATLLVRVLQFGTSVGWHVERPTPLAELEWRPISVDKEEPYRTAMGEALTVLARTLDSMESRAMVPAVLLITDGNPTDDFDAGLAALMGTRAGRSAIRLALAVGNDVDEDCLTRFIANPGIPVLHGDSPEEITDRLRAVAFSVTRMSETGADREAIAQSVLGIADVSPSFQRDDSIL